MASDDGLGGDFFKRPFPEDGFSLPHPSSHSVRNCLQRCRRNAIVDPKGDAERVTVKTSMVPLARRESQVMIEWVASLWESAAELMTNVRMQLSCVRLCVDILWRLSDHIVQVC